MEEMNREQRPVNPRRRKKTKWEIFKEAYLPLIIVAAAALLILVFIIGSIVKAVEANRLEKEAEIAASEQQEAEQTRLRIQADLLMSKAQIQAYGYDYDGAIATLESFEGDISKFPQMTQQRDQYNLAKTQLVAWNDPNQIMNLSLQMLIADPSRAFQDEKFSYSFTRNFLTCDEFSAILQKLYDGGYVLVNTQDVYALEEVDGGAIYKAQTIYLPSGKKPLILTQTNVNYHTYLTDSDGDKLPDGGGRGFASKLVFDEAGELTCEYADPSGQTLTGNYDMIPILNAFVKEHPDFSYHGAKAVIALTGYDGLFGYRTNSEAERHFGTADYEAQIEAARKVGEKLVADGYELACYTFENKAYGNFTAKEVEADLSGWTSEVTRILPDVKIFAYAQNSDIASEGSFYNDQRFTILSNAGFEVFLGFSNNGKPWTVITDSYVRQGRTTLSPSAIKYHADWFGGLLDDSVLDPNRGEIPK